MNMNRYFSMIRKLGFVLAMPLLPIACSSSTEPEAEPQQQQSTAEVLSSKLEHVAQEHPDGKLMSIEAWQTMSGRAVRSSKALAKARALRTLDDFYDGEGTTGITYDGGGYWECDNLDACIFMFDNYCYDDPNNACYVYTYPDGSTWGSCYCVGVQ
jgi:hypothetical protein